jgi:hypothetical protein
MSAAAFAAVAMLLAAGAAPADQPITTAPTAGPAAPEPTTPVPPLSSTRADAPRARAIAMGPCGPEKVKPDGTLATAPHGEVEVGVGNHGYRHLGGSVCQPLGQDGVAIVNISNTQADGGNRRR